MRRFRAIPLAALAFAVSLTACADADEAGEATDYENWDRPLIWDGTHWSRFTLADWNDREAFLKQLLDRKDPYNTRHRPGTPPGPIGAPGMR